MPRVKTKTIIPEPYRIGHVESYNCPNLSDYVDKNGWLIATSHEAKIFFLYKGKITTVTKMSHILNRGEGYVRGRAVAAGLLSGRRGCGKRKIQTLIVVDKYCWNELTKAKVEKTGTVLSFQPCWSCDKFASCRWAQNGEPIEGWKAEPTKTIRKHGYLASYDIKSCPEYTPEGQTEQGKLFRADPIYQSNPSMERFKPQNAERTLWRHVITQAVRDYANAVVAIRDNPRKSLFMNSQHSNGYVGDPRAMKTDCETFFRSDYFQTILDALGITGFCGEDFIEEVRSDPDRFRRNSALEKIDDENDR